MDELAIQMLDQTFSVCKVENYDGIDIEQPFVFTGSTDEEKSLHLGDRYHVHFMNCC